MGRRSTDEQSLETDGVHLRQLAAVLAPQDDPVDLFHEFAVVAPQLELDCPPPPPPHPGDEVFPLIINGSAYQLGDEPAELPLQELLDPPQLLLVGVPLDQPETVLPPPQLLLEPAPQGEPVLEPQELLLLLPHGVEGKEPPQAVVLVPPGVLQPG